MAAISAHDLGEPSREARALESFGDRPGVAIARRRRRVLGLLRDTDPAWHPDLGQPVPLVPVSPKRVLHLLKESYPHAQSGFTVRTLNILKAQVRAGLEPIAVTAPGFPPDVPFTGRRR